VEGLIFGPSWNILRTFLEYLWAYIRTFFEYLWAFFEDGGSVGVGDVVYSSS